MNMKITAYVKASKRADTQKWHRFADDLNQGAAEAKKAVDAEYYGKGILLKVVEGWE